MAAADDVKIAGIRYEGGLPTKMGVSGRSTNQTILASAARTTTQTGADQTNDYRRGIRLVVDITAAGTGSITASIEAKDPTSGKYVTILASAALVTNQTKTLLVFPGAIAVANSVANDVLTPIWRVVITHNNANSITYSVGAQLLF